MRGPVRDFTLCRLAFDCGDRGCWGERTIDLGAVAARRSGDTLVGHIMNRLRCAHCGRPPQTVFLETGLHITSRRTFSGEALAAMAPMEHCERIKNKT